MKLSEQRQGEVYVIAGTSLWGLFPVVATLSYASVTPLTSLWVSTLCAAVFFAVVITLRHRWVEVRNIQAVRYSLYTTFFIGILYYVLYFFGLKASNPGNVSILALSEVFFSFLLFHVWHKHYIPKEHILGAIFMLIGALIVLAPTIGAFHIGNLFILGAAAMAPIGNFYVQKARKLVSTEMIMFVRGVAGSAAICIISLIFHAGSPAAAIATSIPFLMMNGVLVIGVSTMLWIEGIHRISVTKSNALNSLGPLITLLLVWMIFKTAPTPWQLLALIPMFFGVLLLGKKSKE